MTVHYADDELETLCSSGCHSTSYNHDTGGIPYLTCEICGAENTELKEQLAREARLKVLHRRELILKIAVTVTAFIYTLYVGYLAVKTRDFCNQPGIYCEYGPRETFPSAPLKYVNRINNQGYPEWRWEIR